MDFVPLNKVYASDEDVALRARGDFPILCTPADVLASGTDGVFSSGTPWLLTSATVNFATVGIAPNHVVILTKTPQFPGSGHAYAVDSISGSGIVLRSLGQPSGFGAPPGPAAGLTGVAFQWASVGPTIESVSYDANHVFGLDANFAIKSPAQLYDPRELQQWVVLGTLQRLYTSGTRTKDGDFPAKRKSIESDWSDLRARLTLRWGQLGTSEMPTSIFSARRVR
jgi:hypothetical protein